MESPQKSKNSNKNSLKSKTTSVSSSPNLRKSVSRNLSPIGTGNRQSSKILNNRYIDKFNKTAPSRINVNNVGQIGSSDFRKSSSKRDFTLIKTDNHNNIMRPRPATATSSRAPVIPQIRPHSSTGRLDNSVTPGNNMFDFNATKERILFTKNDTTASRNDLNLKSFSNGTKFRDLKQTKTISTPQSFPLRLNLNTSDLLITIYHCCHCATHQTTTWHDEKAYIDNANRILEYSAKILHECQLNVRVGVRRVPNPKKIGCFEITLTYQPPLGNRVHEVLFSKLGELQWPQNEMIEELLTTFLEKIKFPLYDIYQEFYTSSSNNKDGIMQFPCGIITWKETGIGQKRSWAYNGKGREIEWVFDTRQHHISDKYYQRKKEEIKERSPVDTKKEMKVDARRKVFCGAFSTELYSLWCNPSWKFHIYISSTLSDSKLERDIIMNKIAPQLRLQCLSSDIDVVFSDMRCGLSKDLFHHHATWTECEREIKRCKEESNYFFFLSLQSHKYGYLPLPRTILGSKYESRFQTLSLDQRDLLNSWYSLDSNAVPAEYTLRRLLTKMDETTFYQDATQKGLLDAFRGLQWIDGSGDEDDEHDSDLVVGRSEPEYEIRYALQGSSSSSSSFNIDDSDTRKDRIMWVNRQFTGDISSKDFDDCSADQDKKKKLDQLLAWMETKIPSNLIFRQTIDYNQYIEYNVTNYINVFQNDLLSVLERSLSQQMKRRKDWDVDSFGLGIPGSVSEEIILHSQMAKQNCEDFVGYEDQLTSAVNSVLAVQRPVSVGSNISFDGITLSVAGPVGCGKSSFMSMLADRLYHSYNSSSGSSTGSTTTTNHSTTTRPVILRFCGTTSDSSNAPALVTSLCHHINFVTGKKFDFQSVPSVYEESVTYLHRLLNRNAIILVLDGVDQLSDVKLGKTELNFLQGVKPHQDTRIIVSVTSICESTSAPSSPDVTPTTPMLLCSCDSLLRGYSVPRLLLLRDSLVRHAKNIISRKLLRLGRTLTSEQWLYVLSRCRDEPTALYYSLSTIILKDWTSSMQFQNDEILSIPTLVLPPTVPLLITEIFEKFKKQFGAPLIEAIFGLISLAVNGVTEEELLHLLFQIKEVRKEVQAIYHSSTLPKHVWLRVRHELGPLLVERDLRCLCWAHYQFKLNVIPKFTDEKKNMYISVLADHFGNMSNQSDITTSEVPLVAPCQTVLYSTSSRKFFQARVNKRRCLEAVHHMMQTKSYLDAKKELCSIERVLSRIRANTVYIMIDQMKVLLKQGGPTVTQDNRLKQYYDWARCRGCTLGTGASAQLLKTVSDIPTGNSLVEKDIRDFLHSQDNDDCEMDVHANLHLPALKSTSSLHQLPTPLPLPPVVSTRKLPTTKVVPEENPVHGDAMMFLSTAQELELLIHVEYCSECEKHNFSLRHDPAKYFQVANNVLRYLAAVPLDCQLSVRVGVMLSPIRAPDRIGALDVTVGYRNYEGRLSTCYLHSKLDSLLWPSYKGMEKKFRQFLTDSDISLHNTPETLHSWEHTELSKSLWQAVPDRLTWAFDCRDSWDSCVSFDKDWKKNKLMSLHTIPESSREMLQHLMDVTVHPADCSQAKDDVVVTVVDTPSSLSFQNERVAWYCKQVAKRNPLFPNTIKLLGFAVDEEVVTHSFIIDVDCIPVITYLHVDAIAITAPLSDSVSVKYQLTIDKQSYNDMDKYGGVIYLYVADAEVGVLLGSIQLRLARAVPKLFRFLDATSQSLIKAEVTATFHEVTTGRCVTASCYYGVLAFPPDCFPGSWRLQVDCREYEYITTGDVYVCFVYSDGSPAVRGDKELMGTLTAEGNAVEAMIADINKDNFGRDDAKAVFHRLRLGLTTTLEVGVQLEENRSVLEMYPELIRETKIATRGLVDTDYHSTICSACDTLCHEDCSLERISTPGSNQFMGCMAFSGSSSCQYCPGHCSFTVHYHDTKRVESIEITLGDLLTSLVTADKCTSQDIMTNTAATVATTSATDTTTTLPDFLEGISTVQDAMRFHENIYTNRVLATQRSIRAMTHLLTKYDMVTELKLFVEQSHNEHIKITNEYVKSLAEKYELTLNLMASKISEKTNGSK